MGSTTQTAVVVGVGPERGLGASLAQRFAIQGLTVFIVGRTEAKLAKVAAGIRAKEGQAIPIVADATREDHVNALFEAIDTHRCVLELVTCTVDQNLRASLLET